VYSADDALDLAERRLLGILYATVATCSPEGDPWNSPVYSAYDGVNIYWTSGVDAVHSRNIRANGRAFIVFYDSTVPEGVGQGLYLRCSATELDHPADVADGRAALTRRVQSGDRPPEDFLGTSPRRVYRAVPHEAWVDHREPVGGHQVDVRIPVDLKALSRRLRP
jgi:hypothetical protein